MTDDLEQRILAMLEARARTSTICPSDVAREASPGDWRPLMDPVRAAARRLVAQGRVEVTQGGEVVDPDQVKGADPHPPAAERLTVGPGWLGRGMDADEPGWQLLDDFFAGEAAGRAEPTVRRYARVRGRLMQLLDAGDLTDWLGPDPMTLLSAEREFHDSGAFWQLFGPDELVHVLPGFLREPWLPSSLGEARTQISLVSRLLSHLDRRRLIQTASRRAHGDAEAAVRQARLDLEARSADREPDDWAQEMPSRFRQEPGPQW